jgi:hypothetical protein
VRAYKEIVALQVFKETEVSLVPKVLTERRVSKDVQVHKDIVVLSVFKVLTVQ